eukprot:4918868-Amphidinium_carterae.1
MCIRDRLKPPVTEKHQLHAQPVSAFAIVVVGPQVISARRTCSKHTPVTIYVVVRTFNYQIQVIAQDACVCGLPQNH